ncbi:hypothetical protein Tco_1489655, partial [Tanacetum coccineum]
MNHVSLTFSEESQLYDDFEHFRQNKGETIHNYYVRFAKLINDMRNIKMTMSKIQLNSKFVNNMLPEWGRFVTAVKLNKGLKDSNFDQLYAYLKQHEAHANENKMMLEHLTQQTVDPLALMSNVSPQHYHSQSSTNPLTTYHQPHSTDTSQSDLGISPTENLIENLTNTLALLTQSYKTFLPQTNNQLRTSSNPRNQAIVQDGRVVVQNVHGRQNRGQGNNARGTGVVGYGRTQNRVGNDNTGQATQLTEHMAPVQFSSGPAPNLLTPGPISSGLVPNPAPAIPYAPPTNKELEILFQPMFYEYFNLPGIHQNPIPNVAQDPVIPTGSSVSMAIDLDAPSGSHTSSPLDHHSSSVHHGVAGEQYAKVNPFAAADHEPFVNVLAPDYNSEASTSREITIPESNQSTQPHEHIRKWTQPHELGLSGSDTESDEEMPSVGKSGTQDEGQAGSDPGTLDEGQARSDPGTLDEGQAGSDPGIRDEGQAGLNPDDVAESLPLPTPSVLVGPNLEHSDVEITDPSTQPQPEHMDEGFTAMAYPDVQENLKLTVDEQVIPEEPVSSTG